MFLFERLFGVAVYSLILVTVCFWISKINDYKKIKRILLIYSIALSVMGFCYVPYKTSDLFRIYQYVDYFGTFSFDELMGSQLWGSEIGIANILYWLVAQTGVRQLLPATVCFVCYSCIFYIVNITAKIKGISGKNIAITLFFYMSIGNYMFVITGIRCMLGISLLAFCFFRETVEKKFNVLHLPLYAISALIHTFSAVLIAVRFVIPVFDSKISVIRKTVYLIVFGLGSIFVLRYFDTYIEQIIEKADTYLSGNLYSYLWEYVIAILSCVVMILVLSKWKDYRSDNQFILKTWAVYDMILFITAIIVCFEFTIFHRLTTYMMPIITLPFLMIALQTEEDNQKANSTGAIMTWLDKPIRLKDCVLAVSLFLLLVTCSRGSLSSLKFFVL